MFQPLPGVAGIRSPSFPTDALGLLYTSNKIGVSQQSADRFQPDFIDHFEYAITEQASGLLTLQIRLRKNQQGEYGKKW